MSMVVPNVLKTYTLGSVKTHLLRGKEKLRTTLTGYEKTQERML
jgi:DNA-directed RNA polymerase specialized sigma24 family protein